MRRVRVTRRVFRHRGLFVGGAVFAFILVATLLGPMFIHYDPLATDPSVRLMGPSLTHPFGTDTFGRDVLSRVLQGGRVSVVVGLSVSVCSGVIGAVVGLYSAYYRPLDAVLMRIADGLMSFPALLLALAFAAALGPTTSSLIISMSVVFSPIVARIARSAALSAKESLYVDALVVTGTPTYKIIWRNIFQNSISPVLVQITFVFANAVILEAALSFMGLGIPLPYPSWGNMLLEGKGVIYQAWWLVAFPGVAIALMVFSVNLIGDGMRDLYDPATKLIDRRAWRAFVRSSRRDGGV